jgi:pectin methylesterase-like acyl-CoA thioesterase
MGRCFGVGLLVLVLAAAAAVLLPVGDAAVAGRKISVPGDYPTIQEAVDAVADGDTISVTGGTYAGDIRIENLTDLTISGFIVDGTSNTFTGNSAKDSPIYDLWDYWSPGQNTYDKNKFESTCNGPP